MRLQVVSPTGTTSASECGRLTDPGRARRARRRSGRCRAGSRPARSAAARSDAFSSAKPRRCCRTPRTRCSSDRRAGASIDEHPRAVRADHQRHRRAPGAEDDQVVRLPEAALERHPLAREQPPDDLERLLEPRDAAVVRQAERAVLRLVPACAEPEHEPPAADLRDRRRHLRDQPGRVEARAGDERPESYALGDRRQRGQQRPDLPRPALLTAVAAVEQVVAEPDRVEAALLGGPRHRRVLAASGRRARPRGAGRRRISGS